MITPFSNPETYRRNIPEYNPWVQPYVKGYSNFKMAFCKEDETLLEPKRPLSKRVTFFAMGIAYWIPIANLIMYLAIVILKPLVTKEKVLSYDEAIYVAMRNYKGIVGEGEIIRGITRKLQECNYSKENPFISLDIYESGLFNPDQNPFPNVVTREKHIKKCIVSFLRRLPGAHVRIYK